MTSPPVPLRPRAGGHWLARLSRFDGVTFHPVTEGSVDAAFVHVFVHGWQPGYRVRERLLATTDAVDTLPAWDPRLVDATGRSLISDYLGLLEALAALGDDHAVLWYSWLDESATDADLGLAHRSRQATQVNGRRLAVALQEALPGGPDDVGRRGPRLHLIGHSHGSAVITHAAASLARAPEQLTLLDAPDGQISRVGGAADLIEVALPRLRPGRGPGRVFVESYASAFGRSYHRRAGLSAVVDVSLVAPPAPFGWDPLRAINFVHLYAVEWYARSVREAHRGVGYGWSPLRGFDVTGLHSGYRSALPLRALDLVQRRDLPVPGWRLAHRATRRRPVEGLELRLDPATPDAAAIVASEPGDQLVEFDLAVENVDGSESVEVGLDGVPAFVARAALPVPVSGRYLMLADGRPGERLLTARLTWVAPPGHRRAGDPGDERAAGPTVTVRNVRVLSGPGHAIGFSLERSALSVFLAGLLTGTATTFAAMLAPGWTARRVLAALTRRRQRA